MSHLAVAAVIAHKKRFFAISHPLTLGLCWIFSFLLSILLTVSAIIRLFFSSANFSDGIASPSSFKVMVRLSVLGKRAGRCKKNQNEDPKFKLRGATARWLDDGEAVKVISRRKRAFARPTALERSIGEMSTVLVLMSSLILKPLIEFGFPVF